MSSDRNLLFGMLALQMGLVSREQLLDGMHAWMLQKNTPLGEILCGRGALDEEARGMIDGVVEYQVKRRGGARESLASFRVDPRVWSDLEQAGDPDVLASLASVPTPARACETVWPSAVDPAGREAPDAAGLRYRRLRHHASGGLGEVFVALDTELNREVALKEIQARHADHPDSRARFMREAEVTGSLEHPGVVPVYGMGRDEDGRPLYAMRFIKGEPMQEAIRRFHKADEDPRRDPAERGLELRGLLTRFVAVCYAVGYAHARGVVHRDLKPQNVMLGEFGETLVVDWGLAKVLGQPDGALTAPQTPIQLDDGGTAPTRLGEAMGTPAYMPPEQARGEHDRVGGRTDVWALGALLYAVLTGRPPYGGGQSEARDRAAGCDFVPAEKVRPGVPRALAAVCGRAMAATAEARYPTARALAADVERWLADEPVAAYREPPRERLKRWGRRHRTLVASLAVLLCASVVGLGLGLWAVSVEEGKTRTNLVRAEHAEGEAKANLARAEKNLKLAGANLKLAKDAVDECFNVAKGHSLFRQPRMHEARKLLFEKTLPFYRNFRVREPDDPALQWEDAEQWFSVGFIEATLQRTGPARQAYEEAVERFTKLVERHPEVPKYQGELARVHNSLAVLLAELGRREEAAAQFERARALQQKLAEGHPDAPGYQAELANTHSNLGLFLETMGRRQEAAKEYERARALQQKLAERHPDAPGYQADLARTHNGLGRLLKGLGRREEAAKEYERARALLLKQAEGRPDVPLYQADLAITHNNLGRLLDGLGRRVAAAKEYERARALQQKLAEGHPDVPRYRDDLASTLNNLGNLLKGLGRREEAAKELDRARALHQKLVEGHPDVARYQNGLAGTLVNLSHLYRDMGREADGLPLLAEAIARLQAIRKREPSHPTYRLFLRDAHWARAGMLHRLGRHREADADWERAVELTDPAGRDEVRLARCSVRARTGDYRRAAGEADELARPASLSGEMLYDLACVQALSAAAAARDPARPLPERDKRAEQTARRAVALLQRAAAAGYFRDAANRKTLDVDADLAFLRSRGDFRAFIHSRR